MTEKEEFLEKKLEEMKAEIKELKATNQRLLDTAIAFITVDDFKEYINDKFDALDPPYTDDEIYEAIEKVCGEGFDKDKYYDAVLSLLQNDEDHTLCAVCGKFVPNNDHWAHNGYSSCGDCMYCTREKELDEWGIKKDEDEDEEEEEEKKEETTTVDIYMRIKERNGFAMDYNSLTVQTLKNLLRSRGLKLGGRKVELIERLKANV